MPTPPTTLSRPPKVRHSFRRAAILFAGGPAPAANAVISTAAVSFLRNDIEVVGILYGYSNLVQFGPDHPMEEGRDYVMLHHKRLKRTRNSQGIMIGTARTNPGKVVTCKADLNDPARRPPLEDRLRCPLLAGRRRPDLDRRRRHAEDGQQVQALPGAIARRAATRSPSSTCRRRSTTTTWASTSLSATSRPSRCWRRKIRNLLADAEVDAELLPGRDDGPQRRLAGLRGGHRRRGQPGHQRRGHHRQVPQARKKSSTRRRA